MSVVTSSTQVANQAIQLVGNNLPLITGVAPGFDSSPNGIAMAQIYGPTVATVMRQFAWDFGRNTEALVLTGNTAPFPWAYEYTYPADALEILQVMPASLSDVNNPLPINWSIGNDEVSSVQTKVIFCNLASAQVVYNNGPEESLWDSLFVESVVRLLASKMAMAIAGRADTATALLQSGSAFETLGEQRGDV